VVNAVYVSFLENVLLDPVTPQEVEAERLLSPRLVQALRELREHWVDIERYAAAKNRGSRYITGKAMDLLPAFLARRFLPPTKLASKVSVELSRKAPMRVTLTGSVPVIDIWLSITNFNYMDIVLDRLIVDLWMSQPLTHMALLSRHEIPRLSTFYEIQVSTRQISQAQLEWIQARTSGGHSTEPFTLYIDGYFESKVGWVRVKTDLQQHAVEVR